MRGMCLLAAAGVCLLATAPARAQGVAPAAEPGGTLARPASPKSAPPWAAEASSTGTAAEGWSAQEVQLAQARCAVLLKGLDVVAVPEVPLREGNDCGAPAPLRLISLGKEPQVAFSPPPTLTCDMIAQLHKWVQRDVQPMARKFMGAPIVRIETMSSYSCRNAYGRLHGRLSEHARANALDIGSFVTSLGRAALVVSDWGPTAREIAAAAAADSKAQAAATGPASRQPANVAQTTPARDGKAQAASAGTTPRPASSVAANNTGPQTGLGVAPPEPTGRAAAAAMAGFSFGIPGVMVQIGGASDKSAEPAFGPAQRLGGPKAKAPTEMAADARLDFLRAVHAAACRQFGTVLGPEANNTHKNHFHLDLADRPHGVICE
jgi:hypothetical protein